MAIITYPLNNIEYTAEDAELYHATRTSGVFANDDFPITVSGDGNVVTIGEGIGWIRNSKFSGKVVANKSEMSLDLGLPHATYPRIDAVVLQFNANANASEIIVKNGTAQTNPMPPEVIRTESVYELHLYHVYREAGAASVTSSNVTDLRSDSSYCGIMSDDVTMLGDDYVGKDMVGVANGVASLDGSGKVPEAQLPSMNYIPTSQKGVANGVATLDSSGKVPSGQLNLSSSVTSTSATTAANSYAVKQAYDKAVSVSAVTTGSGSIVPSSYSNISSIKTNEVTWRKAGNLVSVTAKAEIIYESIGRSTEGVTLSFKVDNLPEMEKNSVVVSVVVNSGLVGSSGVSTYEYANIGDYHNSGTYVDLKVAFPSWAYENSILDWVDNPTGHRFIFNVKIIGFAK